MANGGATGITRILRAFGYSWKGLRATFRHEEAFRQELILVVILAPLSLVVGNTGVERALLLGSLFLILIIEVLNSGIEATMDRFGPERHKLAARAKGDADLIARPRSSRFCVRTRRGDRRAVILHKGTATPFPRKSGRAPAFNGLWGWCPLFPDPALRRLRVEPLPAARHALSRETGGTNADVRLNQRLPWTWDRPPCCWALPTRPSSGC